LDVTGQFAKAFLCFGVPEARGFDGGQFGLLALCFRIFRFRIFAIGYRFRLAGVFGCWFSLGIRFGEGCSACAGASLPRVLSAASRSATAWSIVKKPLSAASASGGMSSPWGDAIRELFPVVAILSAYLR
jgi:hypothetical protein